MNRARLFAPCSVSLFFRSPKFYLTLPRALRRDCSWFRRRNTDAPYRPSQPTRPSLGCRSPRVRMIRENEAWCCTPYSVNPATSRRWAAVSASGHNADDNRCIRAAGGREGGIDIISGLADRGSFFFGVFAGPPEGPLPAEDCRCRP